MRNRKNVNRRRAALLLCVCGMLCLAVAGCKGKSSWSTLDPDTAKAIDADFRGKVWKLQDGDLYVVKCKVKVQEDGSLESSSPSSKARLKDSDLIPVIYTEDTKFYVKTISGDGGESQEREGSFEDLELHMTLDMKGEFGNDGFHPSQIRMLSIS